MVAAGHGKSSVLPVIVLITSLGPASPHPPPLSLATSPRPLWNHALLTRRQWCHRAQGCMMGWEEEEEEEDGEVQTLPSKSVENSQAKYVWVSQAGIFFKSLSCFFVTFTPKLKMSIYIVLMSCEWSQNNVDETRECFRGGFVFFFLKRILRRLNVFCL